MTINVPRHHISLLFSNFLGPYTILLVKQNFRCWTIKLITWMSGKDGKNELMIKLMIFFKFSKMYLKAFITFFLE